MVVFSRVVLQSWVWTSWVSFPPRLCPIYPPWLWPLMLSCLSTSSRSWPSRPCPWPCLSLRHLLLEWPLTRLHNHQPLSSPTSLQFRLTLDTLLQIITVFCFRKTDWLFRWLTSGYQAWWRWFPGLPGSPQSWSWRWLIHRFPRRDRGSVPQHEIIIPELVRSSLFIKLIPYELWHIVACPWKHILYVMQTAQRNAS